MIEAKLQSIKGKSKFDEIFKTGRKFNNKDCLFFIKFKENPSIESLNERHVIYYAVAISKKIARKAVIRNRIKRLLRESLRQLLRNNSKLFNNIAEIIVIWRWAPLQASLIGLNEVNDAVSNLLQKVQLINNKIRE